MNIPFLLAAIVGSIAVILHVYTFEVWIWPKLRNDCFPATPMGGPAVAKDLYRKVWHLFTVSWVLTIGLLFFFTFGGIVPYANMIVWLVMIYWIFIVITIFVVAALSLRPGQSYIKTMATSFQWMVILVMVSLMFWGTTL
jgi:hypothetical protein